MLLLSCATIASPSVDRALGLNWFDASDTTHIGQNSYGPLSNSDVANSLFSTVDRPITPSSSTPFQLPWLSSLEASASANNGQGSSDDGTVSPSLLEAIFGHDIAAQLELPPVGAPIRPNESQTKKKVTTSRARYDDAKSTTEGPVRYHGSTVDLELKAHMAGRGFSRHSVKLYTKMYDAGGGKLKHAVTGGHWSCKYKRCGQLNRFGDVNNGQFPTCPAVLKTETVMSSVEEGHQAGTTFIIHPVRDPGKSHVDGRSHGVDADGHDHRDEVAIDPAEGLPLRHVTYICKFLGENPNAGATTAARDTLKHFADKTAKQLRDNVQRRNRGECAVPTCGGEITNVRSPFCSTGSSDTSQVVKKLQVYIDNNRGVGGMFPPTAATGGRRGDEVEGRMDSCFDAATRTNSVIRAFEKRHCIDLHDKNAVQALSACPGTAKMVMMSGSHRHVKPPCVLVPTPDVSVCDDRVETQVGVMCCNALLLLVQIPLSLRFGQLDVTYKCPVHHYTTAVKLGNKRRTVHPLVILKLTFAMPFDKHGVRWATKFHNKEDSGALLAFLEEVDATCIALTGGRGLCELLDEVSIDSSGVNINAFEAFLANRGWGCWCPGCKRRYYRSTGAPVPHGAAVSPEELVSTAAHCRFLPILVLTFCIVHYERELEERNTAANKNLPLAHANDVAEDRKAGMLLPHPWFYIFTTCLNESTALVEHPALRDVRDKYTDGVFTLEASTGNSSNNVIEAGNLGDKRGVEATSGGVTRKTIEPVAHLHKSLMNALLQSTDASFTSLPGSFHGAKFNFKNLSTQYRKECRQRFDRARQKMERFFDDYYVTIDGQSKVAKIIRRLAGPPAKVQSPVDEAHVAGTGEEAPVMSADERAGWLATQAALKAVAGVDVENPGEFRDRKEIVADLVREIGTLRHALAQEEGRSAADTLDKATKCAASARASGADGGVAGNGLPIGALCTKPGDIVLMLRHDSTSGRVRQLRHYSILDHFSRFVSPIRLLPPHARCVLLYSIY